MIVRDTYIDAIIVPFIKNVFLTILEFVKPPYLRPETHMMTCGVIRWRLEGNFLVSQVF